MSDDIIAFRGEYRFLSNFWPSVIRASDLEFPTMEHYYQAQKTRDHKAQRYVSRLLTPAAAKRFGRSGLTLREDWEDIKLSVMRRGLEQKFADAELAAKLLATGDALIIEGNNWGDRFWGMTYEGGGTWLGKNWLGCLLMERRAALRGGKEET